MLRSLFRCDWVVYSKRPFGGAEHALRYLGCYTHRVAISNHRLVDLAEGHLPLARLRPQEQETVNAAAAGRIPAPLLPARVAQRVCAHTALRVIRPPPSCRTSTALPATARPSRPSAGRRGFRSQVRLDAPALAMPTLRRSNGPAGTLQPLTGSTPFSSKDGDRMLTTRSFSSRTDHVLQHDCRTCAHAPNRPSAFHLAPNSLPQSDVEPPPARLLVSHLKALATIQTP